MGADGRLGAAGFTAALAPGASQALTLTIRAKPGTPVGSSLFRAVTVSSQATGAKDVVKATVPRR